MTDPAAIVRTRLLAISGVTALVSTRVYTGLKPQSPTPPLVLVLMVGRVQESHLRGPVALQMARVQVHYAATTRAEAVSVANAAEGDGVGSGLTHYQGTIAGARIAGIFSGGTDREEFHANELLQYEVIRDYLVHCTR